MSTGTVNGYAESYEPSSTDLVIPQDIEGTAVTSIGSQAFSKEGLSSVQLPEGLETIEDGGFLSNQLTAVELPSSMVSIGKMGFAVNKELSQVQLNEGLQIIDDRAFNTNSSLESIVLPDSLHSIGNFAFNGTKLQGDIRLGSQLKKVGDNAFKGASPALTLSIAEGSSPLEIGINAFQSQQAQLILPQNRPIRFHARAFQAPSQVILDGGQLDVSSVEDTASLLESVQKALPLSIYTRDGQGQVIWDVHHLAYDSASDRYRLKGKFDSSALAEADASSASRLIPQVSLRLLPPEETDQPSVEPDPAAASWKAEDFEYGWLDYKPPLEEQYQVFGITSFSALGLEKADTQKDLVIPSSVTFEENGQSYDRQIMGIGPSAFKDVALESLVIPEADHTFIIQGSAFENSGLSSVSFGEGLELIGPRAFFKNKLTEVTLPSTLWTTGSQSFMHNSIESLNIHPNVERLQIDNYSFANNQLTSVDLPYDIFKFREYVFKANPGVKPLAEEDLLKGDPAGTGVVRLNSINPHQLRVETYIAPSRYHDIVNVAPDINRDDLFTQLRAAQDVLEQGPDLDKTATYDFNRLLASGRRTFTDPSASQEQIDQHAQSLKDLIESVTVKNLAEFRQTLDQATRVNADIYTEDSLAQLQKVIQAAQAVLQTDYTEATMDQAIQGLKQAMDQLEIVEALQYTTADFTYDGSTVTGLSDSGLAKKEENKHLVIPDLNPQGEAITAIGDGAFPSDVNYGSDTSKSKYGFQSVRIPETVTHIGARAFFSNNLTRLDLPQSLKTIGPAAFNGNSIQHIVLPEGLTSLGVGAFALNESQTVSIPSTLEEIASGAFSRNIELKELTLSEGNRVIGQSAFIGDPLVQINIPSTVEEIGRMAFQASRVEELTIPGNVKVIGDEAFNQNVKWPTLKTLILEEGIEKIGKLSFGNALLSEVFLPQSLRDLDPRAFEDNRNEYGEPVVVKLFTHNPDHLAFNTDASKNNHQVIYFDGDRTFNADDFSYEGTTITGFSEQGQVKFNFNKDVVLPEVNLQGESIEAIAADAFHVTEGVTWNRSVSHSPNGMQSVVIPDTVKSIGQNAFRTNALTAIQLPEGLVEIGPMAFNGNQLQEVIIPDSVTQIGVAAFSANPTKQVHIGSGITEIPDGLFGRNGKLEKVTLPEGITRIGESAFMGANIKEITIPDTVERIERIAFNTNHFQRLEIPSSVKYIGPQAFQQKEALEYPDLTELILHEGLEEIDRNAFEGTGLTEVYLPNSLQKLAYDAFDTVLDEQGQAVVVKLYTENPDHLKFNTEKSMDHQIVVLIEKESKEEKRQINLTYDILYRYTTELQPGDSRLVRQGQNGILEVTEEVIYRQGKEVDRQIIDTQVIKEVIPAIVEIGQKLEVEEDPTEEPTLEDQDDFLNLIDMDKFQALYDEWLKDQTAEEEDPGSTDDFLNLIDMDKFQALYEKWMNEEDGKTDGGHLPDDGESEQPSDSSDEGQTPEDNESEDPSDPADEDQTPEDNESEQPSDPADEGQNPEDNEFEDPSDSSDDKPSTDDNESEKPFDSTDSGQSSDDSAEQGQPDTGPSLVVKAISNLDRLPAVLEGKDFDLYDIYLINHQNEKVEAEKAHWVRLPIAAGRQVEAVLHLGDDLNGDDVHSLAFELENGQVVFQTDDFSYFAVVYQPLLADSDQKQAAVQPTVSKDQLSQDRQQPSQSTLANEDHQTLTASDSAEADHLPQTGSSALTAMLAMTSLMSGLGLNLRKKH